MVYFIANYLSRSMPRPRAGVEGRGNASEQRAFTRVSSPDAPLRFEKKDAGRKTELSDVRRAELVQWLAQEVGSDPHGFHQEENVRIEQRMTDRKAEVAHIRAALDALETIRDASRIAEEKLRARERGVIGIIAQGLFPVSLPRATFDGQSMTARELRMLLSAETNRLFLYTNRPRGTGSQELIAPLRDAGIRARLLAKLETEHIVLSQEEVEHLLHDARVFQSHTPSLHEQDEAVRTACLDIIHEVQQVLGVTFSLDAERQLVPVSKREKRTQD